jgi:hypothetical protein
MLTLRERIAGPRVCLAAVAVCCLSAFAPAGSMYNTNLVSNPSFEAFDPMEGRPYLWSYTGDTETWPYADLVLDVPEPTGDPVNWRYIYGGQEPVSTVSQSLDVSSVAAHVDRGGVTCALSAYLGGQNDQEDSALLTAEFLDGVGGSLGTLTLGPVTAGDRGGVTGLLYREDSCGVPADTRSIDVTITMTWVDDNWNDGYVDLVNLTLVPEPAALSLLVLGGLVLMRRRRR